MCFELVIKSVVKRFVARQVLIGMGCSFVLLYTKKLTLSLLVSDVLNCASQLPWGHIYAIYVRYYYITENYHLDLLLLLNNTIGNILLSCNKTVIL